MQKRGQISGMTFVYILAALVAALILAFGIKWIFDLNKGASDIELAQFMNSFNNELSRLNGFDVGSKSDRSFSLPGVEKVCFSSGENVNEFVDRDFNFVFNKVDNVYFFPGASYKLNRFILEESPLCLDVVNGKVLLSFESISEGIKVDSSDKKIGCTVVSYSGNYEDKIDIVFLKNDYFENHFKEDVSRYVSLFDEVEPFNQYTGRFNFYLVDEEADLGCDSNNDLLLCDSFKVKELASKCPNDYIYVLTKRNKIEGFFDSLRSTAQGNVMHINTADNDYVVLHEFGHAFGNLADEYIIGGRRYEVDAVNCGETCNKWSALTGGCYNGCTFEEYYRPTVSSIMRNYRTFGSDKYGIVSAEELLRRLGYYQ